MPIFPRPYKTILKCRDCGARSDTGKAFPGTITGDRKFFLCAVCLDGKCIACGEALTDVERRLELRSARHEAHFVCGRCFPGELKERHRREVERHRKRIAYLGRALKFQLAHHRCACGALNDSRYADGHVTGSTCLKCLQLQHDRYALKRTRPKDVDRRTTDPERDLGFETRD